MNWLLPEHIADALPSEAAQIERLRRILLDLFRVHGYELVMPPLLEYLDSLLTGSGHDLRLRTFKLVDQLSGRTLGVRADITPQVARIDAHLLNRQGVTRLCYCASVLHTLPASLTASREPIQLGAELYGHAGVAADREVIRLMAAALDAAGVPAARIDLGHVGVFRALAAASGLDAELEEHCCSCCKPRTCRVCASLAASSTNRCVLRCWRCRTSMAASRRLPRQPGRCPPCRKSLRRWTPCGSCRQSLPDLPLSFDLADLRGYHYHNGVVFAAYCPDFSSAIARGGRYDGVGRAFGRARPATGFSMDLRELARLAASGRTQPGAILAPAAADTDGTGGSDCRAACAGRGRCRSSAGRGAQRRATVRPSTGRT
jgi:ATP phosphoribosyltransferase regulatory subunit